MNIPLVGGAPAHLATKRNPKICLRTNQRAPTSPHWHPSHPVLTRRSEGMSKYHHTAGYAPKGRRPTWPGILQSLLVWSIICSLLLICLWITIEREGGNAIGIRDPQSLQAARLSCIEASTMYIIVGTIAAIPLLWRWWQDPPKGMHVQHSKHIADCSYPLKQELSTTRNNLNHPPWCMPPPEKESTIPTDARCHCSWRRLTVCVEGNIGSGKSTLLRGLQDARCTVYQEPVDDRWKPLLQAFYENPSLWSFPLQIEVLKWFRWLRDTVIRNPLPTSCGFQSPTAREGYTRKPEPAVAGHNRTLALGRVPYLLPKPPRQRPPLP